MKMKTLALFALAAVLTMSCTDTRYVYLTAPAPPCADYSVDGALRYGQWDSPCNGMTDYFYIEAGGGCLMTAAWNGAVISYEEFILLLDTTGTFHGWQVDVRDECGDSPCGGYLGIEICGVK